MQVIIFPNENGGVAVVYPAPSFAGSLGELASTTVPVVAAWRVVDASALPDQALRDRWRWTASGPLDVADPPPPPVPPFISFPQMIHGMKAEGWITEAEGFAWLARTLPVSVQEVIEQLPAEMRLLATARALQPTDVHRSDPFLNMLAAIKGKTPEQLDAFFVTYAQA